MKETLSYYCQYNLWANGKLARFFSDKPERLLSQSIENSYPSIRKTFLHILSAEKSWLARMAQDVENNTQLSDSDMHTQEIIVDLLRASQEFANFVELKGEEFLNQSISYSTWDGKVWHTAPMTMIHHCMNHSTYHRGQLITLARQLDMKEGIPSTDLLYFHRERDELQ